MLKWIRASAIRINEINLFDNDWAKCVLSNIKEEEEERRRRSESGLSVLFVCLVNWSIDRDRPKSIEKKNVLNKNIKHK